MPEKVRELKPPRGFSKLFFRLPIKIFNMHLGWIFGSRLLLLNHIGRKSGLQRQAVLEVAYHDKVSDTFIVNVAFGKRSDWYQNLMKTPNVSIMVGSRTINVHAEDLPLEEGGKIMVDFLREHPIEARMASVIGYRVKSTEEDFRALGEQLSFVRFTPRSM